MGVIQEIRKNQVLAERRLGENEKDKLLSAQLRDVEVWKKRARHTRDWLFKFLNYNVAEISYVPPGGSNKVRVVCTLSKPLIKSFVQDEKPAYEKENGAKSEEPLTVYDLERRAYRTINLKNWRVLRFVTMITENAELLDGIVRSCRRK